MASVSPPSACRRCRAGTGSSASPCGAGGASKRAANRCRSSAASAGSRSVRSASTCSSPDATSDDKARAAALLSAGRRTSGSCHPGCPAARAASASSVASWMVAERFCSSARVVVLSALAAMASATRAPSPGRAATDRGACRCGGEASSISRSPSVSSGDRRMTGSQTGRAGSAASRRISSRGASGIALTASAMAARTRTASSSTRADRAARTCWAACVCSAPARPGSRWAIFAASRARTRSSPSVVRMACRAGVAARFMATAARTITSESTASRCSRCGEAPGCAARRTRTAGSRKTSGGTSPIKLSGSSPAASKASSGSIPAMFIPRHPPATRAIALRPAA